MYVVKSSSTTDLKTHENGGELRRASPEMVLAYNAMFSLGDDVKKLQDKLGKQNISFILGTSHGVHHATKDFLQSLAEGKRARPFIFQNSLHSSITGFICQQYQLTGPSFTVSKLDETGEACLDLAKDLLKMKMAKCCIVLCVDGLLEEFKKAMMPVGYSISLGYGAGCVVLSEEKTPLESMELSQKIEWQITDEAGCSFTDGYYDSNCIQMIDESIKKKKNFFKRTQPFSKKCTEVKLQL